MAKYSKKIVNKICDLLRKDSYTIVELCRISGICKDTYFQWINTKPDFSDRVTRAREEFEESLYSEAKNSLMKKVKGYTVTEKHTTSVDSGKKDTNGNPLPKIKEQKIVEKHFQPDSNLIEFVLTNKDPENWKNRQTNELTGKGGKDLFTGLTDDELDARIQELQKKLNK